MHNRLNRKLEFGKEKQMNKLIPQIGAEIVAVTVFLFAVCMFLPIGYIMMVAGFNRECCEEQRVSANIGLFFQQYMSYFFSVYFAQTTSVRLEALNE